jgi:hypothetical protein
MHLKWVKEIIVKRKNAELKINGPSKQPNNKSCQWLKQRLALKFRMSWLMSDVALCFTRGWLGGEGRGFCHVIATGSSYSEEDEKKKRNTTASPRLNSQLSPFPYHTQFNRNFSPFVSFQSRVFVLSPSSKSCVWFGLIRIVESHPTIETPAFSGKPNQSQINGKCVGMYVCLSVCVCLSVPLNSRGLRLTAASCPNSWLAFNFTNVPRDDAESHVTCDISFNPFTGELVSKPRMSRKRNP